MKEIIKQLKARGISQRAFAEKLGVHETRLSQWISGYRNPSKAAVTAMKLVLELHFPAN